MSAADHFIDPRGYRISFVCKAPEGSSCNTGCVESCDAWGEGYPCDHDRTRPLDYCGIVTWLEENDGDETAEDDHPLIPIDIRWDGDLYRWRIGGAK